MVISLELINLITITYFFMSDFTVLLILLDSWLTIIAKMLFSFLERVPLQRKEHLWKGLWMSKMLYF